MQKELIPQSLFCTELILMSIFHIFLLFSNSIFKFSKEDFYLKYSNIIETQKKYSEKLLTIDFLTVFDYLYLLEQISLKLNELNKNAIIYLAAAVSDFYIPETELSEHKIQSTGTESLELFLKPVPKMLYIFSL